MTDINQEPFGASAGADQTGQLEYPDCSPSMGAEKAKEVPDADAIAHYAAVKVGDDVRSAARNFDQLADDLRDKSVGDLLSSATDYGKAHPPMMMVEAAVVGFALSRLVKAGVARPVAERAISDTGPYVDSANVDSLAPIE